MHVAVHSIQPMNDALERGEESPVEALPPVRGQDGVRGSFLGNSMSKMIHLGVADVPSLPDGRPTPPARLGGQQLQRSAHANHTLNGPLAVPAGDTNKALNETKTLHRLPSTPLTHRARNPERLAARQTTVALVEHGSNLRPVASHDEIGGGAGSKELGQQANVGGVVEDPTRAHDSGRRWPPSRHRMEKLKGGVRGWAGMSKIGITPPGSKTYAPYTPAVVVGNHVWLSGQINIDAGDDIVSQTQGTLDKIDALLAEAGTSKHDLVFVQVLLKTMDYYAPMNEVYGAWLEGVEVKPTRAAFAVDALPADALVEIVVQAVKSD